MAVEPEIVRIYLVRYGLARAVGRFAPLAGPGPGLGSFGPGQKVVIRSHRGVELGEVLGEAPGAFDPESEAAPILRVANDADLERGRAAERDRSRHFASCLAVFEGATWPLDLIDAEPLLEPGRTVLHYLGPHKLDASGLVAALKHHCDLDVVLEPAGIDFEEPATEPEPEPGPEMHGCGSCGSGGGGCGSGSSGGCGSCAVKALVGSRKKAIAVGD